MQWLQQHKYKSYSSKLVKLRSIHLVLVNMPRKKPIKNSYLFLSNFLKRNYFVYSLCFTKINTSSKNPLELAAEVSYPVSEIVIGGAMFLRYFLIGWSMFLRYFLIGWAIFLGYVLIWLSNVSEVCSHWLSNVSEVCSHLVEQCFWGMFSLVEQCFWGMFSLVKQCFSGMISFGWAMFLK